MKAVLGFEAWKRRGVFALTLLSILGVYAVLRLSGAAPGAYLATIPLIALLTALLGSSLAANPLYDAARRGELGITLLLPHGPWRLALASGLFTWASFAAPLLLGALITGLELAPLAPEAPGDLLRAAVFLSLSLGAAFSAILLLVEAVRVAYHLGRAGVYTGAAVFVGGFHLLGLFDHPALWQEPKVRVGDFGWLQNLILPGVELKLAAFPADWPLALVLLGVFFLAAGVVLAARILAESEV